MAEGHHVIRKDLYEALEVHAGASSEEIKKAFRRVALNCHPDRNAENREAEERFKDANDAYAVLGDPEKRKRYDLYRQFRARSANLGFVLPPSPVYEKILEDFFLNNTIPGFAPTLHWNWESLARLHPLFSITRNSLLFLGRFYGALRRERIFASPWTSNSPRGRAPAGSGTASRHRGAWPFLHSLRRDATTTGAFETRGSSPADAAVPPDPVSGDREWTLPLTREEAKQGPVPTLSLPAESAWERVRVRIPPGIRNGVRLRVRNKGNRSGGEQTGRGHLYLRVQVG